LLDEGSDLLLGRDGREANDAGEFVFVDSGGLISLQDFDFIDARRFLALLKADLLFGKGAIDVA
jgi:hypothetical protein